MSFPQSNGIVGLVLLTCSLVVVVESHAGGLRAGVATANIGARAERPDALEFLAPGLLEVFSAPALREISTLVSKIGGGENYCSVCITLNLQVLFCEAMIPDWTTA